MAVLLKHSAVAGFFESDDVQVTIEPNHSGNNSIEISSKVEKLFGDQIRSTVNEMLASFQIESATVSLKDRGALDYVLRARLETAIRRALAEESHQTDDKQGG